jgi:DNA adenine methylase
MLSTTFQYEGGSVLTAARTTSPVLRYPGGKQRLLSFLRAFLPTPAEIEGQYVEPFVGGAAVFLDMRPTRATIADSNPELVELYIGIRDDPSGVWDHYSGFGDSKEHYHEVRALNTSSLTSCQRAARLLYLNRTCFKGNWRHNAKGQFNIGYGGQSRRWVITESYLRDVARALDRAEIQCSDFEPVVDSCGPGDFLFLDPPYRRGERELIHQHYAFKDFSYDDQIRLAASLRDASRRGVRWVLTNSNHRDVIKLYGSLTKRHVRTGRDGAKSGEVVITSEGVTRHAKVL